MEKETALLIELHYFPSISFFSKFFLHPNLILEQHENYVKRSFRNRTHIASANGLLRLSVPLAKGKNQQQSIREVSINYDENWQSNHWTAICSAYGNAPFFEYYIDDFQPLFEEPTEKLFDFNLKILNTLFFVLDIAPTIQLSESYVRDTPDGIIDFRNRINPKTTVDGADKNFQIIPYTQVFVEKNSFLPNLSILDLIFCKGPETVVILENSILKE